jgi:hypothetical protein
MFKDHWAATDWKTSPEAAADDYPAPLGEALLHGTGTSLHMSAPNGQISQNKSLLNSDPHYD